MSEVDSAISLHELQRDHSHEALHARVEVLEHWIANHIQESHSHTEETPAATEALETIEHETEAVDSELEESPNEDAAQEEEAIEEVEHIVEEMHEQAKEQIFEPDTMPRPRNFLIRRIRERE